MSVRNQIDKNCASTIINIITGHYSLVARCSHKRHRLFNTDWSINYNCNTRLLALTIIFSVVLYT